MHSKIKKTFVFLLVFIAVHLKPNSSAASGFDHTHKTFSQILTNYLTVKGGSSCVKYREILSKKDDKLLNSYLSEISRVSNKEFQTWSNNRKLAFLTNAYNAYTMKLILTALTKDPTTKSIKDVGVILTENWHNKLLKFFGKSVSSLIENPWKLKIVNILGKNVDLDTLESEMIRDKFKEPRIHFALNCASIGCPSLQAEAFNENKLELQFENAAVQFLADKEKNRYDAATDTLYLSEIFDWYVEDFESSQYGSVNKAVAQWIPVGLEQKNKILQNKVKIDYLTYDWNLNICR